MAHNGVVVFSGEQGVLRYAEFWHVLWQIGLMRRIKWAIGAKKLGARMRLRIGLDAIEMVVEYHWS